MLKYNGSILKLPSSAIVGGVSDITILFDSLDTVYSIQGNLSRLNKFILNNDDFNTDFNFITYKFEAMMQGSSSTTVAGQVRIFFTNKSQTSFSDYNYTNQYGLYDFYENNKKPFFVTTTPISFSVNSSASSYVTYANFYNVLKGYYTSLWSSNVYANIKLICDRNTKQIHVYVNNVYLGIASGYTSDFVTWNTLALVADVGQSFEYAYVRNLVIAATKTLDKAQAL